MPLRVLQCTSLSGHILQELMSPQEWILCPYMHSANCAPWKLSNVHLVSQLLCRPLLDNWLIVWWVEMDMTMVCFVCVFGKGSV